VELVVQVGVELEEEDHQAELLQVEQEQLILAAVVELAVEMVEQVEQVVQVMQ
jgi:hypothetical protein